MPITNNKPDEIQVAVVGHIDHGKSTLIGRLLLDCHQVSDERLAEAQRVSDQADGSIDPSLLTDQLSMERQQMMTVDMTQAILRTPDAAVVFIDTPGHRELLGNMLSGAGMADGAVLVVDVQRGIEAQTLLHVDILGLLGVRQVVVAINKMDLVAFDQRRFRCVAEQVDQLMVGRRQQVAAVVPLSARTGDGVVHRSSSQPWYVGPTLLNAIHDIRLSLPDTAAPLCCPIQDIRTIDGTVLHLARMESGTMVTGDQLMCWPLQKPVTIERIHRHFGIVDQAQAPECVGLEIKLDTPLSRGAVLCSDNQVYRPVDSIAIDVVRVAGAFPRVNQRFTLQSNLTTHIGQIENITVLDSDWVNKDRRQSNASVLRIKMRLNEPAIFDPSGHILPLHRLILARKAKVWGVGVVRDVN